MEDTNRTHLEEHTAWTSGQAKICMSMPDGKDRV